MTDNGQRAAMARGMRPNLARDGAKKNAVDSIPVKEGMRRVTAGTPAAYHHGIEIQDEPNSTIIKDHERPIGYHTVNTDAQIAKSGHSLTASQVFHAAKNHGRDQKA